MDSAPEDWQRLATYVVRRRTRLGFTQEDVRARGGPSTATQRLIEGALQTSYRNMIIGRLERALDWMPGSVEQILGGGEPTPLPEPRREQTVSDIVAAGHRGLDELEALERELTRRVTAARRSAKDLERAVTALRLVQGDSDDSGAN